LCFPREAIDHKSAHRCLRDRSKPMPMPSGIYIWSCLTTEILLESYRFLFDTHAAIFRYRKRTTTHTSEKLCANFQGISSVTSTVIGAAKGTVSWSTNISEIDHSLGRFANTKVSFQHKDNLGMHVQLYPFNET
jgi:hypothetical protein